MPLDSSLIAMIVAGLVLAYLLGMVAHRLRLPPILGYVLAGVAAGQVGLSTDPLQLAGVAQFGVIVLLFGVGLRFSFKDVMGIRMLAALGAIGQLVIATLLGAALGLVLGWDVWAGLLFGLALSSASGVMLHQTLHYRGTNVETTRMATGWLAAQYLIVVLALIVISAFATLNGVPNAPYDPFASFFGRMLGTSIGAGGTLALTLVKIAAFIGFMMVVGLRVIPWVLHSTGRAGSRELVRLGTLAIALGVAWGAAGLFGVPLALGALLAGMIFAEHPDGRRAALQIVPLREAFAVLFFVTAGMMFDPAILVQHPLSVLATLVIIVGAKAVAGSFIVARFGRLAEMGAPVAAMLAQIGELAFVGAGMGVALAMLPVLALQLILAGLVISIVLNPLVFWLVGRTRPGSDARTEQRKPEPFERNGVRIEPGTLAANEQPLPPGDNVLAQAAAAPAVTSLVTSAVAEARSDDHAVAAAEDILASAVPADPASIEPEPEPEPGPELKSAEVVVVIADAGLAEPTVETAPQAESPEPAAEDVVAVPVQQAVNTEPGETLAEAEELELQEADQTSEGGIAPDEDEKPPTGAPPVLPEPKG